MSDQVIVETVQDLRAREVQAQLTNLQSQTEDNVFDTCDLLLEARDNGYHLTFGFTRFNDWIEMSPQFDLSPRQAAYYVNIAQKALLLEVDRATMKAVKIGKLKEIFSLNPDVHSAEMKALIQEAPGLTLDEVKLRVRGLKTDEGQEAMLFMTIKYPESAREVIDLGLEKARRMIGTSKDGNGDQVEPSNGKCVEFICADFAAGVEEGDLQPSYTEIIEEGAEAIA